MCGTCVECLAEACGCHVRGFAEARDAALACIHPDIYPRPNDTAKSLAARLSGCPFLDEINAKWRGHGGGGRRVDLNSTCYSQPRRATFSVVARDSVCPETEWLYAYTHHGRPPEDFRCRPMPMDLFEFGVVLWKIARPLMYGNSPPLSGALLPLCNSWRVSCQPTHPCTTCP